MTFKEWMIEQGAWESYLENMKEDKLTTIDAIREEAHNDEFINVAFDWERAKHGNYDYWNHLEDEWLEYLQENAIKFD